MLMKRYPPRVHDDPVEDGETIKRHLSAMVTEMEKKKPREIVLLPLLKQTYSTRRDYITSDERSSVAEILKEYPALYLPSAVSAGKFIRYAKWILTKLFELSSCHSEIISTVGYT